ncbi:hypothetical protein RFI_06110, partial [Reticulomyxa filosa]
FELTAKSTTGDGHHVKKLNELLGRLKAKYEKRIEHMKQQYTEKIATMNVAVTKLNNVRMKLSKEIEQLTVQLKQKEDGLEEHERKCQDFERELDRIRNIWTKKEDDIREKYEQIHTQLKQDIESMKINVSALEHEKKDLEKKLEQSATRMTELTTERDNLHNQLQLAKDELSTHGKQRNDMEEQLNDVMEQLENTKQENKKLHSMNQELTEKQAKMIKDCQTRMENALQQKMSVDVELKELQRLHDTKVNGMDSQLEKTLKKYQQLAKENELLKGYQVQNQDLARQVEQVQKQLEESQNEQLKLHEKMQHHNVRRKEQRKELKELQTIAKDKDLQLHALNQKLKDANAREIQSVEKISKQYETMKRDLLNLQKTLSGNDTSIEKLMKALDEAIGRLKEKLELKDLETSGVFEFMGASFADEHIQPTYSSANMPSYLRQLIAQIASITNRGDTLQQQCHKYEEKYKQLSQLSIQNTQELERLVKENSELRSEISDLKVCVCIRKKKQSFFVCSQLRLTSKLKHLEAFQNKQEESEADFEDDPQRSVSSKQESAVQTDDTLEERRSQLSFKMDEEQGINADKNLNAQAQLQLLKKERDDLQLKLTELQQVNKQLQSDWEGIWYFTYVHIYILFFFSFLFSLNFPQLVLISTNFFLRNAHYIFEIEKRVAQLNQLEEEKNTFSANSFSILKEQHSTFDNEEKLKKVQIEMEKIRSKAEKWRAQRDFAKSKYKELKAKLITLDQRFVKPRDQKNAISSASSSKSNVQSPVSATAQSLHPTNASAPLLMDSRKSLAQNSIGSDQSANSCVFDIVYLFGLGFVGFGQVCFALSKSYEKNIEKNTIISSERKLIDPKICQILPWF